MCFHTYHRLIHANYIMSLIDQKVKVYGELSKIDPFEFWDTDVIDKSLSKSLKQIKKRNWLFIVYPESAPEDWKKQLEASGVQFAVSPLHDKDVLVDGEYKKPHWHMIITFEGPTTFLTASSFRAITNGPYPKVCENLKNSYEYFTHKNQPEKAQYSPDEIEEYNGFTVEVSRKDVRRIKQELLEMIVEYDITEFLEFNLFVKYCLEHEYIEVVTSDSYYFTQLINSYRHNPERAAKKLKWLKQNAGKLEVKKKEDKKNDS